MITQLFSVWHIAFHYLCLASCNHRYFIFCFSQLTNFISWACFHVHVCIMCFSVNSDFRWPCAREISSMSLAQQPCSGPCKLRPRSQSVSYLVFLFSCCLTIPCSYLTLIIIIFNGCMKTILLSLLICLSSVIMLDKTRREHRTILRL